MGMNVQPLEHQAKKVRKGAAGSPDEKDTYS
jgi:hypothetical protein